MQSRVRGGVQQTGAQRQLDKSVAQLTPGGRRAPRKRRRTAADIRALARHAARVAPAGRFRRDDERPSTAMWDMAGDCERPQRVELWGEPLLPPGYGGYLVAKGSDKPTGLTLGVRCRLCRKCLLYRRRVWTNRSKTEWLDASVRGARTWLGTLTWSLDQHHLHLARVRQRMAGRHIDYDALSPRERFARICDHHGADVTRWLKRVRKRSGCSYRYLVVAEAHKSGWPHYHVLVHEYGPDSAITERELRLTWQEYHGWAKFNLVLTSEGATYAAKYLSKSALARVRASRRYGFSSLEGRQRTNA